MFRYYSGVAIMCVLFAIFTLFLGERSPEALATIFIGFAGAFLAVAFITSGPESRW
ncbi:MAG: hypothetical protein QJR06_10040 [Alicyclobacillaceae bacterium]|nr:hypothetical protein [Alicyclobacillaceae bacterium]